MYTALPMDVEEHRNEILKLWIDNMSDRRISDVATRRFPWYYNENPDGAPTTTVLLDDGAGQIVGSGSFFPRSVVVDGRCLRIGILSDFVVSPAHRAAGPAIAIQRSLAEAIRRAGVDFLATYPNKSAEPIFRRIGYKLVGASRRWVKPLLSNRQMRKRVPYPIVAGPASGAVNLGLTALDVARLAGLSRHTRNLRPAYPDSADARFDALWEKRRTAYTITGERTAAYLRWRYLDFPSIRYRFFTLSGRADDRIAAYLTYYVNDHNACIIGDLFSEDAEDTLSSLLLRFSASERRLGRNAVCLDYVGADSFGDTLAMLGFHCRPADRSLFVYFDSSTPEDIRRIVLNPSNWFTLDAEMDI